LADWIVRDGLIQLLFSAEFLHTETLKRCIEIPRFLGSLGLLSDEHLDLIWDASRQSAHESIRHGILSVLQGIFQTLNKQQASA
ncbi:unnamed protein product, partial [Sphacelaria rigidula]